MGLSVLELGQSLQGIVPGKSLKAIVEEAESREVLKISPSHKESRAMQIVPLPFHQGEDTRHLSARIQVDWVPTAFGQAIIKEKLCCTLEV